jgi:hypothetical protein
MRDQEIVGLWEAYSSIYTSQEEEKELDENVVSNVSDFLRNSQNPVAKFARFAVGPVNQTSKSEEQRSQKRMPKQPQTKLEEVETDLFDYILEHLVAEGYADTNDAALSIMANMSEEWKQSILEADSLAAQRARREARLARQRKREGRPSGGGDFGHDYSKPRAQADAEREERMRKFINKEESIVGDLLDEGEKPFPDEKVKAKQVALRSQGGNALERRMRMGLARRRAKEARRTGDSQQSAGAGWYHGR